jgi:uncharacterized membrane protein YgcG
MRDRREFVAFCAGRAPEGFRASLSDVRAAAVHLRNPIDSIALTAAVDIVALDAARAGPVVPEGPHSIGVGVDEMYRMNRMDRMDGGDHDWHCHTSAALLGPDLEVFHARRAAAVDEAAGDDVTAVGFRAGINMRAAVSRALGATPALLGGHLAAPPTSGPGSVAPSSSRAQQPKNSSGGDGTSGGGSGGSVRTFAELDAAERRCADLEVRHAAATVLWASDLDSLLPTDQYAPMNAVRVEWRRVTAAWRAAWVDHDLCAAKLASSLETSICGGRESGGGGGRRGGGVGGDGGGGWSGGGERREYGERSTAQMAAAGDMDVDVEGGGGGGGFAGSGEHYRNAGSAAALAAAAAAAANTVENLAPRIEALLRVASERWHRLVTAYAAELEEGRASLRPEHAATFGYDALDAELAAFLGAHDRSRRRPLTSAAPSRGEARAWGEAARGALARWLNAHAAAWRAVTVGIVKDEAKYDALVAAGAPPGGHGATGWRRISSLAAPLDALAARAARERAAVARERVALRSRWGALPALAAGVACQAVARAFAAARADDAAEALLGEETREDREAAGAAAAAARSAAHAAAAAVEGMHIDDSGEALADGMVVDGRAVTGGARVGGSAAHIPTFSGTWADVLRPK